jgi:hypothetical protein
VLAREGLPSLEDRHIYTGPGSRTKDGEAACRGETRCTAGKIHWRWARPKLTSLPGEAEVKAGKIQWDGLRLLKASLSLQYQVSS